jgi:large subunit ribosomal protein L46
MSAVCLERKPVICRELNEVERKFSRMLADIELENSHKSDHEVRYEEDILRTELLKKKSVDLDMDQTLQQTAQDFEDAAADEYNNFQFESRITEADKTNDLQSIERKLDRHLLLLVQQKHWDQKVWAMPQGMRMDGETMLQTAERVLKEICGADLTVLFYGNAPCGVYKYKYPKRFIISNEQSAVGAKVFFFKAQYIEGRLDYNKQKLKEFKWLNREELRSCLSQEYYRNISQFLIDEE